MMLNLKTILNTKELPGMAFFIYMYIQLNLLQQLKDATPMKMKHDKEKVECVDKVNTEQSRLC